MLEQDEKTMLEQDEKTMLEQDETAMLEQYEKAMLEQADVLCKCDKSENEAGSSRGEWLFEGVLVLGGQHPDLIAGAESGV